MPLACRKLGKQFGFCVNGILTAMSISLLAIFAGCTSVPATVENDPSLEFIELQGYKFHVQTYGDKSLAPVIVVHGGPGGDSKYLYRFQQEFHIPSLPAQTVHLEAKVMGRNMLTFNSVWSVAVIGGFFGESGVNVGTNKGLSK